MRKTIIFLTLLLILTSCGKVDNNTEELVTTQLLVPNNYEGIEKDVIKNIYEDDSDIEYTYEDSILTIKTTESKTKQGQIRSSLIASESAMKAVFSSKATMDLNDTNTELDANFNETVTSEEKEKITNEIAMYMMFYQSFDGVSVDDVEVLVTSKLDNDSSDDYVINKEYFTNVSEMEQNIESVDSSETTNLVESDNISQNTGSSERVNVELVGLLGYDKDVDLLVENIFGDDKDVEYTVEDGILKVEASKTDIEDAKNKMADIAYKEIYDATENKLINYGKISKDWTTLEIDFAETPNDKEVTEVFAKITNAIRYYQGFSGVSADDMAVKVIATVDGEGRNEAIIDKEMVLGNK